MHFYRAALLRFADDGRALYDEDGLLAVGPDANGRQRVLAAGAWRDLAAQYAPAPVTSSPEQLRGAGALAARYPDVWVQSHVAENLDEIAWVRGLFPAADAAGFAYGLASDVGGGTSFSPFRTMLAAYTVARARISPSQPGLSLSAQHLWWQHTAGAARALGLDGVVGNLQPGCEADFVVLNPQATPLLARRRHAA